MRKKYASNVEIENKMEIHGDEVEKCGFACEHSFYITIRTCCLFSHFCVYLFLSGTTAFNTTNFDNIPVSIEQFRCAHIERSNCDWRKVLVLSRSFAIQSQYRKKKQKMYACQPYRRPPKTQN